MQRLSMGQDGQYLAMDHAATADPTGCESNVT